MSTPNEILEAMQPRLAAAKWSYLRRSFAAIMAVPLLLGVGVAWASSTPEADVSQVAGGFETNDAGDDHANSDAEDDGDKPDETKGSGAETEAEEDVDTEIVALGIFGAAEVTTERPAALVSMDLAEGWEAELVGEDSRSIVLLLSNKDTAVLATIAQGIDGFAVSFVEVPGSDDKHAGDEDAAGKDDASESSDAPTDLAKTEPTPKPDPTPKPKPTEKPEPEFETRKEIGVFSAGSVVVERTGDSKNLELAVTWTGEGYESEIVTASGELVHARFVGAEYIKEVKAWTEGASIHFDTWYTELEPAQDDVVTRKEIDVFDVGAVVIEREDAESPLWLGVTWTADGYEAVVVTQTGTTVEAYFVGELYEKHVQAWADGNQISYETWYIELAGESEAEAPYTDTIVCEFGAIVVSVANGTATVESVTANEGVGYEILVEVGEYVKVLYETDSEVWIIKAWGSEGEVVYDAYQE